MNGRRRVWETACVRFYEWTGRMNERSKRVEPPVPARAIHTNIYIADNIPVSDPFSLHKRPYTKIVCVSVRGNRGHHHRQRLRGDRRPPQEVNQRVTATLFVATSLEQAKQPLTQNALYTVFSRPTASTKTTTIFELISIGKNGADA